MFEMAERGLVEVADPARAFLAEHDRRRPAASWRRCSRASRPLLVEVQALVAPTRGAFAAPDGLGRGSQPAGAAGRGARPARRATASAVTTSTPTSPAACRSPSRASTSRSPSRSRRRCATGRSSRGPSRSARWACSASCAPSAGSTAAARGRATRVHAGDRPALARPVRAGAGDEMVEVGSLAEAVRAALGRPRRRRHGHAAQVGLHVVEGRCRVLGSGALAGARRERDRIDRGERVIRTIRVLGAALGAFIGLGIAATGTGLFTGSPTPGSSSPPGRSPGSVVGFALLPYLTVVPARWLVEQRPGPLDRRVRRGGPRPVRRPPAGPPARPPARADRGPARDLAAARHLAVPGPRHDGPDRRQAVRPDRGRRGRGPHPATRGPDDPREGEPRIVVDTSVLIDGRIAEIVDSGFIYGTLVVPRFVLEELQHIADSSDALRRNRGRRGLEILSRMQRDARTPVEIVDDEAPGVAEVDAKLVELAKRAAASCSPTTSTSTASPSSRASA